MSWKFWNKPSELMQSATEAEAKQIICRLNKWNIEEREEILNYVAYQAFPEVRHVHRNPKKAEQKEAVCKEA